MRPSYRTTGATSPRRRPSTAVMIVTAGGVLAGVVTLAVVGMMLVGPPSPVGSRPAVAATTADVVPTPAPPSGLTPSALPTATVPGVALPTAPAPDSAAALLATLAVKGRAPKTGYDRSQFGPEWADTDRNGCDTRNDVLRRDLTNVVVAGTSGCVVLSGTLADPFSGSTMPFSKGTTSAGIHVDHVVALSDAWQKGAQGWTASQRLAFGNDPLNLLAVDGALNMAKGDGDAATWLPPAKGYRCAYVARQVAVKSKYGAWVTQAEHDAIERVLSSCPGEPAPVGYAPVESDLAGTGTTSALPTRADPPAAGCDPAYPDFCIASVGEAGDLNCGDVDGRRFVVLAPDPHGFDGDNDGVGCES